mgnify:CR=1 FL=1
MYDVEIVKKITKIGIHTLKEERKCYRNLCSRFIITN